MTARSTLSIARFYAPWQPARLKDWQFDELEAHDTSRIVKRWRTCFSVTIRR
jgi:hypothetical protein